MHMSDAGSGMFVKEVSPGTRHLQAIGVVATNGGSIKDYEGRRLIVLASEQTWHLHFSSCQVLAMASAPLPDVPSEC